MTDASIMGAVRVHTSGEVNKTSLDDVPRLDPKDDEVLVRMFAAGVNPIDTKVRQRGALIAGYEPFTLGCDGAGIIEMVGLAVEDFAPGDVVFFCYGGIGQRSGTYADYACVPSVYLAHKPLALNIKHAAAAPLVCITAWESLFDRARLQQGQRVFIHGGTGGVGHIAVQLAHLAGCRVACTVGSEKKAELARKLGAELCIHYQQQDIAEEISAWSDGHGVDVVLDTVGGTGLLALQEILACYGSLVSLLQFPEGMDWPSLRLKNILLAQELMLSPMLHNDVEGAKHQAAILAQCAEMMGADQLQIHLAGVMPLAAYEKAHQAIEEGHSCGKWVLDCTGAGE